MKYALRRAFGEAVARRRQQQGLTQVQLAERADLSCLYVADMEEGSRNVSINSIFAVATALDSRISALYAAAELDAYHAAGEHAPFAPFRRLR